MSEQFPTCPLLPTCVCSQNETFSFHRVEPIAAGEDPETTFRRLKTLLAETAGAELVSATDTYIHAVHRTWLGFVDDLECRLHARERVIHVRSASRLALYDFGVNRRRVETLRRRLEEETARSRRAGARPVRAV